MELTTVCLIDDHAIVRQGLKELLMKMNTYQIIYEFNDGDEFLNALPLEKKPDIYILDYSMPHKNGIEVLQELEKREKDAKRAAEDFRDTKRGIESYKATVWDEMQKKIAFLLAAPSLLHTKIDSFLKVLEAVNKFILIGRSFADSGFVNGIAFQGPR